MVAKPHTCPTTPDFTDVDPKFGLIPGNGKMPASFTIAKPIPPKIHAEIVAGTTFIRAWGEMHYRDVFGDVHPTRWAVECRMKPDGHWLFVVPPLPEYHKAD